MSQENSVTELWHGFLKNFRWLKHDKHQWPSSTFSLVKFVISILAGTPTRRGPARPRLLTLPSPSPLSDRKVPIKTNFLLYFSPFFSFVPVHPPPLSTPLPCPPPPLSTLLPCPPSSPSSPPQVITLVSTCDNSWFAFWSHLPIKINIFASPFLSFPHHVT